MKKFTSILCALMVILSVNAAPLRKAAPKVKKDIRAAVENVEKRAAFGETIGEQKKHAIRRAPQATQNIVIAKAEGDYYEGDIQYIMSNADESLIFYFDILLDSTATDVTLGHNYNLDEMVPKWTGGTNDDDEELGDSLYAASFKKWVSNDTTYIIASMTYDATEVYNLSYIKAPITLTGDTVHIICTEPMTYKYYSYFTDWTLKSSNADYEVSLDFLSSNSESPVGSYVTDDFDFDYTYIKDANTTITPVEGECEVTEDGNGRIDVEAFLIDENGIVYHVTMFYAVPTAENFADITVTNLDVTEVESWISSYYAITGSNADYIFEFDYDGNDALVGTHAFGDDLTGAVKPVNGTASNVYSGSITIGQAADGTYTLIGTVLCMNSTEYTITGVYILPDASRTDTLVATVDVNLNDLRTDLGAWQITAYSDDDSKFVSIVIISDSLSGNYTFADMQTYKSYCYFAEFVNGDTIYLNVVSADITSVESANGDLHITGTLRAQNEDDATDVADYTIDITYTKPVASRTATFTGNLEIEGYSTDWYAAGFNAAGNTYISLDFYYSGEFAGTYGASAIYADYSFIAEINGTDTTWLNIIDANLTVAATANGYSITGTVTAQNAEDKSDVVEYTINISATEPTGIQYDSQDTPYSESFASYETNSTYAAQYGVLLVSAQNAKNAYVSLEIYTGSAATTVPNGTYTFDQTESAMTVYAGAGVDSEGYIIGSWAGYLNASGQITAPLWFIVSGSMTVNNGAISISGKNSYDQNINITMNAPVGLDDVEGEETATKMLRNGQVVIRVNDKEYNVLGTELK